MSMAVTGLRGRENRLPIVLHADDRPAVLLRLLRQSAGVKAPSLTSGNPRAGP